MPVTIATPFRGANKGKQPQCPLNKGWKKNQWHIYRMKNYSPIKRNKVVLCVEVQMNLEPITQ